MINMILGIALFFGIHSVSIVAEPFRDRLAARNELLWKLGYSVIAILGLFLIINGYSSLKADPTLLYVTPIWMRHLAALLILPVFILALSPYLPGKISSWFNNPQLVAVKLWASAHLLVNGALADVLLFGSFLVWGIIDSISMKKRPQRPVPGLPKSGINDIILLVVGLGLYVVTALWLHRILFGIAPFG